MQLHTTRMSLPEKDRIEVIALLNKTLASTADLYAQCKQAHWNVKGPEFIALHKLFDEVAERIEEQVDIVAERITSLGGTALGTIQQASAVQTRKKIKPTTKTIGGYAKKTWLIPSFDTANIKDTTQAYAVHRIVAQILERRGYLDSEDIDQFLVPDEEYAVADPRLLKNAEKTVARILTAIEHNEKIRICGDYDVDGMTSSSLLIHCLRPLGADIDYHIPHRVRDGYGLKPDIVEQAANDGCSVLITVDNGITAFDAAKKAAECGIDLIITDHHLAHDGIPGAYTVVNPKQPGCMYPFKYLAGVGVAFKLMNLLYAQKELELPNEAYELMMLGTIADVVELKGENRYWVKYGLRQIHNGVVSQPFKKLMSNARIEKPMITSTDIAFGIAPQLNALGRIDDANRGVQFLLGQDVDAVGSALLSANVARKQMQLDMTKEAKTRVYRGECKHEAAIVLSSPQWHPGVNGLVASKISEWFHKPAIICTEVTDDAGETILKGSGRSPYEVNLFGALDGCRDLLIGWGGHKVAAGLSLKMAQLTAFKKRFSEMCRKESKERTPYPGFPVDAFASFDDINDELIKDLRLLEPFGNHNPQPALLFDDVTVSAKPTFMGRGRQHVKCTLKSGKKRIPVKFFFRPDMYRHLSTFKEEQTHFKLLGTPDENYWRGKRTLEINGIDIEKVEA